MPRVLLLLPPATYRADAFLDAAERMGLAVTIAADATWPLFRRPPDFIPLDLQNHASAVGPVLEYASQRPIHVVIGVDDATAVLAARLAEALRLPHNSVLSVSAARNKAIMRQRLRDGGVPVPPFSVSSIEADANAIGQQASYPCVLKPLILSASCGVIRANTPSEFTAAFERIVALLARLGLSDGATQQDTFTDADGGHHVLVETFIPGVEVALEGLLTDGQLRVLALFDKPDPLDGPYFEETIYVTPSRLPATVQTEIAKTAGQAAVALGLTEGPIHGEFRINDHGVWVIEVAARSIGGRCSRTLRFAAGTSLEELILRHALRQSLPSLDRTDAAGVMMLPIPRAGVLQAIAGEDDARAVPGIEEVSITATVGQQLVPLPEGTRYLGFLIARAADPAGVEEALRTAHRHLQFAIGTPLAETRRPRGQVVRF